MGRKLTLGIVLIIFTLLLACTQQHYDAEENFEVKIIDNGRAIEIVGYKGNNTSPRTEIKIPPRIQNLPVTSIGEEAFLLTFSNIESDTLDLIIPDGITHIGEMSFAGNYFTGVIIPKSVIYIGDYAFANNAFTNVTIPDSVTYLGESSFAKNELIGISIPNGVTHIENSSFAENLIQNLTIPESIIYIGNGAFRDDYSCKVRPPILITLGH